MKILRLNLTAFGPFTDAHIDLSDGKHGLHVVFGSNEAGKSSSLRAISNLLYGFPTSTKDNFIHPYPKLRVGGQLQHSDGALLEIVRRKGNKNSLRGENDKDSVEPAALDRLLGDVDRELFELMFGLNHHRLVQGGQQVANGAGRLGEMLFAAGAGLSDLHRVQTELQQQSDTLLKSSGRSGSIHDGIKQYQMLRKSVAEAQGSLESWKKSTLSHKTATEQEQRLREQINELKSDQNRLRRIKSAIPLLSSWKRLKEELAELAGTPSLAADFGEKSQQLLTELATTKRQQLDAEEALVANAEAAKKIVVPEVLLNEADAIEALRDRVGRYRESLSDRPKVESSRDTAQSDAHELLRQLGREPDLSTIESLRLPGNRIVRIQELGNQQEALQQALVATKRETKKIQQDIEKSQEKLEEIPETTDVSDLRSLVREIARHGDLESRLSELQQQQSQVQETTDLNLARLPLWSGDLQSLARLAVPSTKTIDEFADRFGDANQRVSLLVRQREEVEAAQERLDDELAGLERGQAVPTLAQLEAARTLRERGWRLVRDSTTDPEDSVEGSAVKKFMANLPSATDVFDAYEQSVQQADRLADSLRTDADRVASKAQLEVDRERGTRKQEKLAAELEAANAQLTSVDRDWQAVWHPLGIKPLSPAEMLDWGRQHEQILNAVEQLNDFKRQSDQTQAQVSKLIKQVQTALTQSGVPSLAKDIGLAATSALLSDRCDEIHAATTKREQLEESLSAFQHDLDDARLRAEESESAFTDWEKNWLDEMRGLGLDENVSPSQANRFLADTQDLFQKHDDFQRYQKRLQHIDTHAALFESDVQSLIQRVADDLDQLPADQAITKLAARLQTARDASQRRDGLQQQRSDLDAKLELAIENLGRVKTPLDQMLKLADCDDWDQLIKVATRSNRLRELEQRTREAEDQLLGQAGGKKFAVFVTEVEAQLPEADTIQPRIDDLDEVINALTEQRDEVVRSIERLNAELQMFDGSGKAAEIEMECQSLVAQLEDEIHQLAVFRAASAVLVAGIESHRKKNQGPVLDRASELFSRLTCRAFSGLRADFDDKGKPVLVGVRAATGEAVFVGGMSDGTCDQVYLALRLASLEAWLEQHEPLPLIVDDILLNFDDARSIETLKVLAELSRKTQVIFFTHHQHLVGLAQSNLPADDLFVAGIAGTQPEFKD